MKKVMIDIETLSTKSNAAILSIGAVSSCGDELHLFPRIEGAIDPSTVMWWFSQCDEARMEQAQASRIKLFEALMELSNWCFDHEFKEYWANGITFDYSILQKHMERFKITVPWRYSQLMDFRTIKKQLDPDLHLDNNHSAIADARNQMKYLDEMLAGLVEEVE